MGVKRRTSTIAIISLALVSSGRALSHDEVRCPVVKFIDFYIASQSADAPKMSLWERIIFGLAVARAPEAKTPCNSAT